MRIRSVSDAVATLIAWFPVVAVVAGVLWVLSTGVYNLELRSLGSETFVSNSASTNQPEWADRADAQEAALQAALDSGDTGRMMAALEAVEKDQAVVPG